MTRWTYQSGLFSRPEYSKWTRSLGGFTQLPRKVSSCLISNSIAHKQGKDNKYKLSCSTFAKEVQKIFPSAKLSPYEKAIRFLESSCSPVFGYQTQTSSSKFNPVVPLKYEIFSNAIMYDLLKDLPVISPIIWSTLLEFIEKHRGENGLFSYFVDGSFKVDIDTASACLVALLDGKKIHAGHAKPAAKILTSNKNAQGVVMVFLPSEKKLGGRPGYLDAGSLSNMMGLLCRLEMESEAKASEDFIYRWMCNAHLPSLRTKSYPPAGVLYLLSNTIKFSTMRKRFQVILAKHWLESFGITTNALALAQRILVAHNLGLLAKRGERENCTKLMGPGKYYNYEELKQEVKLLQSLQNEVTGGWDLPGNEFYHCSRFYYGSEDIVTAFAAKALYFAQDIVN